MILVTGATGRVGYRLMEALADAGADTTAMVRVEAKATDLPGAPRHVVATFDDPPPAENSQGSTQIFLLSPAHEEQAELEIVFIDAVETAGHCPHIVKIAADGFQDPDCEVRFMRSHRQVAGPWMPSASRCHLAPSLYMEKPPGSRRGDTIRKEGTIAAPACRARSGSWRSETSPPRGPGSHQPGPYGAIYVVTGPEALGVRRCRGACLGRLRAAGGLRAPVGEARAGILLAAASAAGKRTASSSCSSGSGTAVPTR